VWLAAAPEAGGVTGGYFHKREALTPSPAALDDEAAARLWAESEALVARAGICSNGSYVARNLAESSVEVRLLMKVGTPP